MLLKLGSKGDLIKEWQRFIGVTPDGVFGASTAEATRFFQAQHNLRADGIVGANTLAEAVKKGFQAGSVTPAPSPTKPLGTMEYTDLQIIERVETHAKGFTGWKKGVSDIWVRSAADKPDTFDDKVYTFECKEDGVRPIFIMVCTGTSHAGVYYQQHFAEYNPKGCGVLCGDTYVFESHAYGYHHQRKDHPCYRQVKGFPYTRDNDKDNKAENFGTIYHDPIGANCHRASLRGTIFVIGKYSAACLVRNAINRYLAWLAFMNERPLSVGILNQW